VFPKAEVLFFHPIYVLFPATFLLLDGSGNAEFESLLNILQCAKNKIKNPVAKILKISNLP